MAMKISRTVAAIALPVAAMLAVPSFAQQGGPLAALNQKVQTLSQDLTTTQTQLATAQQQLAATQTQLAATQAQVTSGQTSDTAQMQALTQQLASTQAQVTALQTQLAASQAQLDALKAADQSQSQQLTTTQAQLDVLKATANGMQAQLDALKAADPNLQAQIDALKASDANTQTQLTILKTADANLQAQVDAIKAGDVSFYRRDGSQPLTAPLAGGGQDANNLNNINASGSVNAGAVNTAAANVTTLSAANIIPAQTVAENTACDSVTQGYFAKDGNNELLACQFGTWAKPSASSAQVQAQLDALKANVETQFASVASQYATTASKAQLDALKTSIDTQFVGLSAQLANAVTQAQLDSVKANIAAQFSTTASQLAAMQLQLDGMKPLDFYRRDGTQPLTAPLAGGGQDANNLNNINASGTMTVPTIDTTTLNVANIKPTQIVAANSACDPATQGYFAKNSGGMLLSCQAGIWTKLDNPSAQLQSQVDALVTADSAIQTQLGSLTATAATQTQLAALQAQLTTLQTQLTTFNATTVTQGQLAAFQSQLNNLQTQMNALAASDSSQMYRRDGSVALTGPLSGGGQDANDLRNIHASGTLQADTANVNKLSAINITPNLTVVENSTCDSATQGYFAKDSNGLLLSCQSGGWKKQATGGTLKQPTIAEVEGKETISLGADEGKSAPCPSRGMGCKYFRIVGGVMQQVSNGTSIWNMCTLNADMACFGGSAGGGYYHVTAIGVVHKRQDFWTGVWHDRVWPWY